MKLYDGGKAPNPRRVQIFLKEKGIEIEREQLDINAREQKSEAFSKLNPMQTVPVLELDDGQIIAESVAICRYFEEVQPEPALMGRTPVGKAMVEMWQRRAELNLLMPVAFAFRHLHPGAKTIEPLQIGEWGDLNKERAGRTMRIFDEKLADSEFIAGDDFTIADITAFVACQFMKVAKIERPEELVHLNRWFAAVSERPSTAFD
jgi:glutathione S-transferase